MIRKAEPKDFKKINEIFNEVHKLHLNNRPDYFKDIDPLSKEDFKSILEDENQILLVNEDKEINAFMRIEISEKTGKLTKYRKALSIEQLAVKEGEQNKGIGKKLIEAAKEIFKEKKCTILLLDVWAFNQNAIEFYKHIGFKELKIKMELPKEE